MKKLLIIIVVLLVTTLSHAQAGRGRLKGLFASWYTVTNTPKVITFPYPTRDLAIISGSTNLIAVDLLGGTIPSVYTSNATANVNKPSVIQVNSTGGPVEFRDFETSAITLKALSTSASPVTIIATY